MKDDLKPNLKDLPKEKKQQPDIKDIAKQHEREDPHAEQNQMKQKQQQEAKPHFHRRILD